jgi:Nucleotidyl transferase AbiEii toxin, Type IV TA system
MNNINERLVAIATETNRPIEEVLTYHILEAVLRRVSRSNYTSELVLRGGMMTRLWIAAERRIAVDVDFLALYDFDMEGTGQRFCHILAIADIVDGVIFKLNSLKVEGIWMETEYPGIRLNIDATVGDYQRGIQIDVGFGDPLIPSAQWIDYPMLLSQQRARVKAVRPETLVGWKLHGLVEMGASHWRPKDLYDLMLFSSGVVLDEGNLLKAIATAFSSRNTPLEEVLEILAAPEWWSNSKKRSKWKWYRRKCPTQIMPLELHSVVTVVLERWKPVVEACIYRAKFTISSDKKQLFQQWGAISDDEATAL